MPLGTSNTTRHSLATGITFKTSGEDDPYLNEVQQVVQYSAATKTYTDLGALVTQVRGQDRRPS